MIEIIFSLVLDKYSRIKASLHVKQGFAGIGIERPENRFWYYRYWKN
jgi:hypothetical protein